jgi:hypothetical protein
VGRAAIRALSKHVISSGAGSSSSSSSGSGVLSEQAREVFRRCLELYATDDMHEARQLLGAGTLAACLEAYCARWPAAVALADVQACVCLLASAELHEDRAAVASFTGHAWQLLDDGVCMTLEVISMDLSDLIQDYDSNSSGSSDGSSSSSDGIADPQQAAASGRHKQLRAVAKQLQGFVEQLQDNNVHQPQQGNAWQQYDPSQISLEAGPCCRVRALAQRGAAHLRRCSAAGMLAGRH